MRLGFIRLDLSGLRVFLWLVVAFDLGWLCRLAGIEEWANGANMGNGPLVATYTAIGGTTCKLYT